MAGLPGMRRYAVCYLYMLYGSPDVLHDKQAFKELLAIIMDKLIIPKGGKESVRQVMIHAQVA